MSEHDDKSITSISIELDDFDDEGLYSMHDESYEYDWCEYTHWLSGIYYERSDKSLCSDMDRNNYITQGLCIAYPSIKSIIREIEGLVLAQPKGLFGHLAVVGEKRTGKTLACDMVRHGIGMTNINANINLSIPTSFVQMPSELTEKKLLMSIIHSLSLPYGSNPSIASLRSNALGILSECMVKVLFVDNTDELLSGTPSDVRKIMAALKHVSDFSGVSFVFIATPAVYQRIKDCGSVDLGMRVMHTKDFDNDDEFRKLLKSFEMFLPLKRASDLNSDELSSVIYNQTKGNIGAVSRLIKKAAIDAISSGEERITVDQLDK